MLLLIGDVTSLLRGSRCRHFVNQKLGSLRHIDRGSVGRLLAGVRAKCSLAGDLGGYEDEARSIYAGGLTEEPGEESTLAE